MLNTIEINNITSHQTHSKFKIHILKQIKLFLARKYNTINTQLAYKMLTMNYRTFTYLLFTVFSTIIFSDCKQKSTPVCALVYSDGSPEFNKTIDIATQMHDSGFAVKALHYLDSNFINNPPTNQLDVFHYYYFCFDYYNNHIESRNPQKAEIYSDSMLYVLEKNKLQNIYVKQYAQSIFSKGDALFNARRYTEAYKYFYEAKTIIKDNIDPCALADYSYRLGMVLYKQDRFLEAAFYFEESFNEFNACDLDFAIFYRRQELLDNIGLSFSKAGVSDSAMFYFNSALKYIKENYEKFPAKTTAFRDKANAVVIGNMAVVYGNMGEENKAIDLLQKSISINERKGFDPLDAQLNRLKLANIYYKHHISAGMRNELDLITKTNDSLPDQNVLLSLYDMEWKYYDMTKDVANAFTYLLKYHRLRDSIDVQMRTLRETDLNEQVKNMDKQYQISTLEKNNELKKTYLIIALLGAVMSAIIFLLVFNDWRKTQRNVRALTYLHNQVSSQKVELEHLLKRLEDTHKEKDRVLRAVAHDIRNPIAAISSLSDLLVAEDYNYSNEQMELLTYIKNSCTDALSLTKEILEAADPSKAEALVKEDTDIKRMFADYIQLLRFKAAEKQQNVNVQLPYEPTHAVINKDKIWRVISNLVNNAIKFSPQSSTIDVVVTRKNNELQLSIHDTGIGIPDSIKDKVFDMFTETKRLGTEGEKPFGLGLSISKQIIEAHNGKIWFESSADHGTTFFVTIPAEGA